MAASLCVPQAATLPLDLADPCPSGLPAPARPARKNESAPIIRHISSSQRGGWPLFCRLLLWATRNAQDGIGEL
jgi:hypothetical protein